MINAFQMSLKFEITCSIYRVSIDRKAIQYEQFFSPSREDDKKNSRKWHFISCMQTNQKMKKKEEEEDTATQFKYHVQCEM